MLPHRTRTFALFAAGGLLVIAGTGVLVACTQSTTWSGAGADPPPAPRQGKTHQDLGSLGDGESPDPSVIARFESQLARCPQYADRESCNASDPDCDWIDSRDSTTFSNGEEAITSNPWKLVIRSSADDPDPRTHGDPELQTAPYFAGCWPRICAQTRGQDLISVFGGVAEDPSTWTPEYAGCPWKYAPDFDPFQVYPNMAPGSPVADPGGDGPATSNSPIYSGTGSGPEAE